MVSTLRGLKCTAYTLVSSLELFCFSQLILLRLVCCMLNASKRPAEDLWSSPTMDNLAPAMVVGQGCFHRFDYMRPRSGPG
ncbi:unnamed protein product [Echinostoma caproni]|uniref:Secreted protein n=1 Tax=Echinostoma caproni TaxID=27848 RepID=A0A183B2M7_9TREM|nr:unnamed protein product [Echinostoma caproni]